MVPSAGALALNQALLVDDNELLAQQNDQLVERLIKMEEMLDTHISQSLKAHGDELHELGTLIRAAHAVVCATPDATAIEVAESAQAQAALPPTASGFSTKRGVV